MTDEEPDEQGIYHWGDISQFPEHLKKYWHQRFRIWQCYNQGIWMTEDAWFGVTPEPIANKIAVHIAESAPKEKTVIIDAFAGVGGNAIAFARNEHFDQVFAIEKDPKTMKCAKHNAKVYGVDKKIVWCAGDCFDIIKRRFSGNTNIIIFASPPWGGTEYSHDDVFDLSKMEPYNLEKLYTSFSKYSKHVVLYLPRTSDLNQLARYAPGDKKVEIAHYCIMGASKALCAYYGDFDFGSENEEAAAEDRE
ncbi:trimethylguanosine synthase [Periconia macrospinosa]|uniref:Trimethylguanosine synthase n=1 Tax=Periconia macrospinosa TaxID=97972 RepID=A0A2V1E932_9PLEO|nr:trimethylguanosine synthase [Periconia macrospinosa]